jgi:hypothetical protein
MELAKEIITSPELVVYCKAISASILSNLPSK